MKNVHIVHLSLAAALLLGACDMPSAEVLDHPRVLAIRAEPPALTADRPTTLTALVYDVAAPLDWSFCADAWRPDDPPTCPTGAVALGQGNPIAAILPDLTSGWLLASPADGSAAPAVKRVEADSGAVNPEVAGITLERPDADPLTTDSQVALRVALGDEADPSSLVVSWYVGAGALDPRRTLASEAATLSTPATPGPLRVIAVVRETAGGTAWAETTLDVEGARP